jgi:hypothetical protein
MSNDEATPVRLPDKMPVKTREVETAFKAIYNWNYGPELDKLRALYARGLDMQWNVVRDLDWEQDANVSQFVTSFNVDGIPVHRSRFWKELDPGIKQVVQKKLFAHTMSNILHGEQGAMLIASQLVNAAPDMDAKLFAATQTVDEARHVEVFSAYLKRLDKIYKITPGLAALLDDVTGAPSWLHKMVGMQVVIEGMALSYFRTVRIESGDPMMLQILGLVSRDEARHVAFGVRYLPEVIPQLSDQERAALEDYAFESVRRLKDPEIDLSIRKRLSDLWEIIGYDPVETWQRIWDDVAGQRALQSEDDPIRDLVVPTLRKVNLMSPRIEACFDQIFQANSPGSKSLIEDRREGPRDLQAWVLGEE